MKYRSNSPEYVSRNLEYMLEKFDIDSIYFVDSSIGNDRKQLEGICKILISTGPNSRFRWSANARPGQLDEGLLRLMWQAGCRKLLYGFESGSQRILDAMRKGCTVEQNERAAYLHRKLGFPYHASMIAGFPGETVNDLEATLKWLEHVRPPIVGVNTYAPLPGSEDYYKLRSMRKIEIESPETWRMIGETNNRESPIFANIEPDIFWQYVERMQDLASKLWDEARNSQLWKET